MRCLLPNLLATHLKLAREHLRLVHQIERLGLAQELDYNANNAMLEAVANRGEASIPVF